MRVLRKIAAYLFMIFCFFLISLNLTLANSGQKSANFTISASIYPLYEFSQAIAGNLAQIDLLLPAGANPHNWQPRLSDLMKLEKARALVYIGPSLEPWVSDLVRSLKNPNLELIFFEDLGFLKEEKQKQEAIDPHIWLDFNLDIQIVERLTETFSRLKPDAAMEFQSRAASYIAKLKELDLLYQKNLSRCHHRTLIIDGHGAFNYLARRYGLKQISLHGLSPEAEPRPTQLRWVLEMIQKEKVKAVFYEVGMKPRLAHRISEELKVKILPLHPGHSLYRQEKKIGKNFIELMIDNLKNLKEGLGCE